ncbi:MAG: MMPL family transporter, partial [bacterium]
MQIDEMKANKKDFGWPSLISLGLILLLLINSFKTWKNPFFSVIVLVIAIIWVSGILGIVLEYLNMMSAAFGIILIGLGIDFGIHFISGFKDGREQGLNVPDAIKYMYQKMGAGVITGGLTTAMVFFSLALARFKTYTEMGISIGLGIVIAMVAFFVLLPALIVWDNKGYSLLGKGLRRIKLGFIPDIYSMVFNGIYGFFNLGIFRYLSGLFQFKFLEPMGRLLSRIPVAVTIVIISAVTVILSIKGALNLGFEYDMMKLQPQGTNTMIVQEKIVEKFEIAPDYAMLMADNLEDCREKIEQLKKIGNRTGLIGGVDGITELLTPQEKQIQNIKTIESFRKKIGAMPIPVKFMEKDLDVLNSELKRLHQNIVEIGEMSIAGKGVENKVSRKCDQIAGKEDKESKLLALTEKLQGKADYLQTFQQIAAEILKAKLMDMTSTDFVTLENLPEEITKRYVNPNNNKLLITIFPKAHIWESRNLRKFNEATFKVSDKTTGMPAIFMILIDFMKNKGMLALIIGVCAIILFLLLDFQSFKYTLLAALPLFVGASWMVGLQALFGLKFNMMNFLALPLIVGIGIDDGVHILHRYDIEGRDSMPLVMKTTGRAILLTSLTTMIAFGSWALASHKGTASMGQTLFLGVGTCFLSSALLLPSIITIMEKLNGKKMQGSPEDSRL